MKKIPFLLLMALVFVACDDDEKTSFREDYFPLHVGDTWEHALLVGTSVLGTVKSEITTTITINKKEYYLMTVRTTIGHVTLDTLYYRMDSRGYVYSYHKNLPREINLFRLAAGDGASWRRNQDDSDKGRITVRQYETFELNQTTLDSCKRFSYDAERVVDEEYYDVLAPGLGIVSGGSYGWGTRRELTKAVINGAVYEF